MKVNLYGQETYVHMYLLWDQSLHTYGGMSHVIYNEAFTCMLIRC